MDENKRIVICRRCKKPEYWGEMRWLSGFCVCRDCYKAQWESENHKPYTWDDLDGKRPTMEEFEKAKENARDTLDYRKTRITLNEWFEEWFSEVKQHLSLIHI